MRMRLSCKEIHKVLISSRDSDLLSDSKEWHWDIKEWAFWLCWLRCYDVEIRIIICNLLSSSVTVINYLQDMHQFSQIQASDVHSDEKLTELIRDSDQQYWLLSLLISIYIADVIIELNKISAEVLILLI